MITRGILNGVLRVSEPLELLINPPFYWDTLRKGQCLDKRHILCLACAFKNNFGMITLRLIGSGFDGMEPLNVEKNFAFL